MEDFKPKISADIMKYNMSHTNRGYALIFNHEYFETMETRHGTNVDCEKLRQTLTNLHFNVIIYNNYQRARISTVIKEISSENHIENDCILIVILSHGECGTVYASDHEYSVESLANYFTADKCPSLAGKPKLFFIQACQGDKIDPGTPIYSRIQADCGTQTNRTRPVEADFLIAYSTTPGYYSYRDIFTGSWYIQSLCEKLRIYGRCCDIIALLTMLNHEVAMEYEEKQAKLPWMTIKQMPFITSRLTKCLYFTENSPQAFQNSGCHLDPTMLDYRGNRLSKPQSSTWNPAGKCLKTINNDYIESWSIFCFDQRTDDTTLYEFGEKIAQHSDQTNTNISPYFYVERPRIDRAMIQDNELDRLMEFLIERNCQLVICVIPIRSTAVDFYVRVKEAAEISCGILTQCITAGTILRKDSNDSTITNILLNISSNNYNKNPAGQFLKPINNDYIESWSFVCFDQRTADKTLHEFGQKIAQHSNQTNTNISPYFYIERPRTDRGMIQDNELDRLMEFLIERNCQLVICVIPTRSTAVDLYDRVKEAAEISCGILTQCITAGTILRKGSDDSTINNILLKISSKNYNKNRFINDCIFKEQQMYFV